MNLKPAAALQQQTPPPIDHSLSAYQYELSADHIAQNPVEPRDSARLMVVNSPTEHTHHIFRELPELLQPADLLILNDTQVLRARLYGQKSTGVQVEVLLLEPQAENIWLALVKPGKRLKSGAQIEFHSINASHPFTLKATVMDTDAATGGRFLKFELPEDVNFYSLLEAFGHVPLPPYLKDSQASPDQYQTIYAQQPGAVAAPTAGLHFTEDLFTRLQEKGIQRAFVTLHVGVGTFRPVEVGDITTHQMHQEWVSVPAETIDKIQKTQAQGGRVIAVGTTVVRSLESAAASGKLQPFCGKTDLFIYPGYQWRVVDGLITNFHLPGSSLLMLVSALIGRERLLNLYEDAIAQGYRFYSFGDAMFLTPAARVSIDPSS